MATTQTEFRFDGPAYDHARDSARLTGQILRVFDLMTGLRSDDRRGGNCGGCPCLSPSKSAW
jgi:hypothetical protein